MTIAKQVVETCHDIAKLRQMQLMVAQQAMVQAQQVKDSRQKACDDLDLDIREAQHSWQAITARRRLDPNLSVHWGHHILSLEAKRMDLAQAVQAATDEYDNQRGIVTRADAGHQAALTLKENAIKMLRHQKQAQAQMQIEDRTSGHFVNQGQAA